MPLRAREELAIGKARARGQKYRTDLWSMLCSIGGSP
jgi:hypothetical protein